MKRKIHIIPFIAALLILQSCDDPTTSLVEDPENNNITAQQDSLLTGNIPTEVVFPGGASVDPVTNRPAFDEFSWQTFIALCWPVKSDSAGVPLNPNDPSTFLSMNNTTKVVWTSYKNQWDLFNQGNNVPSAWNDPNDPIGVCDSSSVKHNFLASMAGELNESFSVPLVDQDSNYVYFEIRYNKVQYNFVRNNGLYDNKKLQDYQASHDGQVQMPISTETGEGSIMVKAAWKVLGDNDRDIEHRYYVINENVFDPVSGECKIMKLGLVGFHIAQKVDDFSQWVWSSFEQIDNVPNDNGGNVANTFDNGTDTPPTGIQGFANKPGDTIYSNKSDRVPVQVNRLNPIPTTPSGNSTVDINAKYQALVAGTWMQYYELVITQWPTDDTSFKLAGTNRATYPTDCGQAFPVSGCVNITMETYFQSLEDAAPAAPFATSGGNSCMGCHYGSSQTDFSFSLKLRTHNVQSEIPELIKQ